MRQIGWLVIVIGLAINTAACWRNKDLVAKIDGKGVTKKEFNQYLKLKNIPEADVKNQEVELGNFLIKEALSLAIEKQKLIDGSQIEAEVEDFRNQLLISRYFDEYLKSVVSDDAIKNYYTTNINEYQVKQVHIAHILLRFRPQMTDQEKQAVRTKAHTVYSNLKGGSTFDKLVGTYSEDSVSKVKGGDLGWIREGAISKEVMDAAFALANVGDYTAPVESPFGIHIVKLVEPSRVVQRPFEAVKGDIRYLLAKKAKETKEKELLSKIKIERLEKKS
jgi:peptidyl-prolyl cis-trans isomerase C